MPDLYALPDTDTPFRSDAEMIAHVGSWRYQNDSAFRAACEAKMALGIPGTSTLDARDLEGRHDVIPEKLLEQAAGEEAQQRGGVTTSGMARVTFSPDETIKAVGEAAQRRAAAAAESEQRRQK